MFCKKCGVQIEEEALFCPKCGEKQGDVADKPIDKVEAAVGGIQFIIALVAVILGLIAFFAI